ncbi:MAG: type II toxin-antitoxin system HicA family toxin [Candidatus Blackburnbacteria bacterium]|nr:type II toxin-antitoxin system HicA family toxin [Candidatus Blackburnbacteria bacterium]
MPQLSPIKRRKFEKFLKFIGCKLKRTKGDHLIYDRPGLDRPVVITSDNEIPIMIIRTNSPISFQKI